MATLVLQPGASGEDTKIISGANANYNYGATDYFQIGNLSGIYHRGLIKFDLSSLPSGCTIVSATLRLWCTGGYEANARYIYAHRGLVQFYEGIQDQGVPSEDGSTWNYRNHNGSVAWASGAGGGPSDRYYLPTGSVQVTTGGSYYEITLTSDVQGFVNGTYTNYGWWLQGEEITATSRKDFSTSESSLSSHRPQLTIEYVSQAGTSSGSSSVSGILGAIFYAEGISSGVGTATAILVSQNIAGTSSGVGTATGDIAGLVSISGTSSGASTAVGQVLALAYIAGTSSGVGTATGIGELAWTIHGDTSGVGTAIGKMWGKYTLVAPQIKFSTPLLYITDGTTKSNGQKNRFDLISPNCMFKVQDWRPIVLGDKSGGYWNDSPVATGRRLVSRTYGNIIEVFELIARSHSQDDLIYQTNQLYRWLESAADYWVSDWATLPIYLVARAPYETNERYAIVHYGSVPELENPYRSPFFSQSGAIFRTITLRLEHGIWRDKPPGQSTEVAISSYRNYTVTAWSS